MTDKRFSISARINSFGFAFRGLAVFFKTQHNAWIHLGAAILAIGAGFYFKLNSNEWCWILLAVAMVFITEMLNTAIEFLSDVVSPQLHPVIKKVKDVAAAAVLIAALAAIAIGLIVFLPKIY